MANNDRKFPVLYRFFDSTGDVIYIGSTWTPHLRWRKHESVYWFPEVAVIKVEHFSDVAAMRAAEIAAILREQPRYNLRDRGIGYYAAWAEAGRGVRGVAPRRRDLP